MSRTKISLAPLIPYGIIASVIGIFGVGFYELIVDDNVDTKVREASQKTESNVKYMLLDANTITREEGTLSYTFNFLSRPVTSSSPGTPTGQKYRPDSPSPGSTIPR